MPPLVGAAVRVGLSGVFGLSAGSKAWDLRAFRASLRDFGVGARLTHAVSGLVILVELITAGLLLWSPGTHLGAGLACGLLLVFSTAVAITLALGRAPDCRCFGSLSRGRIGLPTIGRNIVFGIGAGWLYLHKAPQLSWDETWSALSQITISPLNASGSTATPVLIVLVCIETVLVLTLFLQHGRILIRLDALEAGTGPRTAPGLGLPIGAPVPLFALQTLDGEPISTESLRSSMTPTVLVFTDRGCSHCQSIGPKIATWQRQLRGLVRVLVFANGGSADNQKAADTYGLTDLVPHQGHAVPDAFSVHAIPAAVLVRANGTIGSATAFGADAVVRMVDHLAASAVAGTLDNLDTPHVFTAPPGGPQVV